MVKFIVGIWSDQTRLVYFVEAETREDAFAKVEESAKIQRDPYGRSWIQEVEDDVHFITTYPIPNPYVG